MGDKLRLPRDHQWVQLGAFVRKCKTYIKNGYQMFGDYYLGGRVMDQKNTYEKDWLEIIVFLKKHRKPNRAWVLLPGYVRLVNVIKNNFDWFSAQNPSEITFSMLENKKQSFGLSFRNFGGKSAFLLMKTLTELGYTTNLESDYQDRDCPTCKGTGKTKISGPLRRKNHLSYSEKNTHEP